MTQKLSDLIQRFPWMEFPPLKTKVEKRRQAAKKAARTLKRQKAARAKAEAQDLTGKAA